MRDQEHWHPEWWTAPEVEYSVCDGRQLRRVPRLEPEGRKIVMIYPPDHGGRPVYEEIIDWTDRDEAIDLLSMHAIVAAVDAMRACSLPWSRSWLYFIADIFCDTYTAGGGQIRLTDLEDEYTQHQKEIDAMYKETYGQETETDDGEDRM